MLIRLKSIRLRNFRGYVDSTIIFDENLNVIIGKNDVGKSTILEALEIFFNNEQIKIEPGDLNVACHESQKVFINCCFKLENAAKIVIDSTVPTQLDKEFLLNSDGLLEIEKEWDCSKKAIGVKDLKTYIIANYPIIGSKPLVCEKISNLKTILQKCVDKSVYEATDKTKSSEIRKAIYAKMVNRDTNFELTQIDTAQEDAKDIWNSLKENLPLYFLFKSDRVNTDKDSEVQSPMKAVTKTVIAGMQSKIDEIVKNVKDEVEKIGQDTIDKLAELDPQIAKSLVPEISTKPFDSVFSFDLVSDGGIPLNKRGSGIRRLILLSYFRAEAEKRVETDHNQTVIFAIEEPETSQHPDYQKMILETLQRLSQDGRHQIILTTHTPEIAKMVDLKQLIFIYKNDKGIAEIETECETKYREIVRSLGILPFAVEQCVICVEGENDVNFLQNINRIPEFNKIVSFTRQHIRIVPLQGSNLIRWINSNYFAESNIKEIHYYDNDRDDYRKLVKEISDANDGRRYGWLTRRREIENYIPPALIEKEFNIDLSKYKKTWETVDVPKILSGLLFTDMKDASEREKIIKQILNGRVSKKITADTLKEINAFEDLETFFKKIKAIVEGTYVEKKFSEVAS
jgi:predicted ATP-dependent endonuclease of OLD family